MNALRRAWHVYTAPAASDTAGELKALIPFTTVLFTISLVYPELRHYLGVKASDIVLLYAILWVVRQRDEARARLLQADAEEGVASSQRSC